MSGYFLNKIKTYLNNIMVV